MGFHYGRFSAQKIFVLNDEFRFNCQVEEVEFGDLSDEELSQQVEKVNVQMGNLFLTECFCRGKRSLGS